MIIKSNYREYSINILLFLNKKRKEGLIPNIQRKESRKISLKLNMLKLNILLPVARILIILISRKNLLNLQLRQLSRKLLVFNKTKKKVYKEC